MPVMDYVNELKNQRDKLADILTEKGVEASHEEKFNTLIPKVREVSGGGGSGGYIMENAHIHDKHIQTVTSEILLAIIDNAIFEEV